MHEQLLDKKGNHLALDVTIEGKRITRINFNYRTFECRFNKIQQRNMPMGDLKMIDKDGI